MDRFLKVFIILAFLLLVISYVRSQIIIEGLFKKKRKEKKNKKKTNTKQKKPKEKKENTTFLNLLTQFNEITKKSLPSPPPTPPPPFNFGGKK